ncbi:UPF0323 family lipoprotein [Helicobacter ailurogastricus]|uniref:UPF0323 family lipoprotein n=1 Tax=Helicobacter ailurogastricus TaxID=1578720 RepID=UPI000CF027D0|nr:UPF0323 family lipoprotein [Helicobacter ailurogastricus]GLH57234.1 Motility protein [Helicobacter ailurogastricus]GLH59159.1 Motility protein [Helicobacter ailurogastricus]
MQKPFRKISDYAIVGGLSALVVVTLVGCKGTDNNQEQKPQSNTSTPIKKGAFVILQEQADKSYKVAEEYPSDKTRVVVRDLQGKERMLSDEEIQKLIKDEEVKIDKGTSQLTKPAAEGGGSGLGIGAAILGSAAGAILGSYIGNKLFNNPNYHQNAQRNYTSPQAYQRSQNSFRSPSGGSPTHSGFFSPQQGAQNTPSSASPASTTRPQATHTPSSAPMQTTTHGQSGFFGSHSGSNIS